jgi:tetratricopeptide (TPR) repeat protein
MDAIQASGKMDFNAKLKEADVYQSMGLIGEAIEIYRQILSGQPDLESHKQDDLREKIEQLEKKNEKLEKEASKKISSEDLSYIKKTLAINEDVSAVLDSAFAFKELGLFSEACSEYEKLFNLGYPAADIIPDLIQCHLELRSPAETLDAINTMIDQQKLEDMEKGMTKYLSAMEMGKRGHNEQALSLYKSAGEIDPENDEIRDRINFITASLSTGSKYDYLLNQNIMDTEQLKKALALSKKMAKSLEFILIDQLKIEKEELGKSLSLFYGCPFKSYSEEFEPPVELISKLKETFLLHELWVPLSWDQEGVSVLVDDPRNLGKTDNIKALMKTKKLILSVGIKEDIEAFIRR